jgi:hypothetical protein
MSVNYGSKRIVVGAHYGLRDWLAQRVTGVLMALFTLALLAQVLLTSGDIGYDKWAGIFSAQWTTSSPSAPVSFCKFSPSSGLWLVPAGRFRSSGGSNS